MSKLFAVCKVQLTALILACIFLAAPSAFADVPTSLTQQGRLLTADGQPMKGNKTLLFELYDAPTDGQLLWSDQFDVDLGNTGFYTAILGSTENPIDHNVLAGGPTFMQLVIDDKPLLPRLELTSVPYAQIAQMAHQAKRADSATHADTAGSATTAGHADTAGRADSVNPGSINAAALASNAVTAEKIASVPWSKISDPPNIPAYTGADFVTSGQSCTTAGQMVTGISATGTLVCATPVDNDTKYTAGSGLSLTGNSFSIRAGGVTDSNIVDMSWTKVTGAPAITGRAVSSFVGSGQACTGANVIQGFKADGTLNCIVPPDTKYTAGGGLNLSGTSFTIAPSGVTDNHIVGVAWAKVTGKPEITGFASSDFVKSGTGCTGTQFFMGFNANGTLRCGQPQDTTYTAQPGQGLSLTGNQFGVATGGILSGHIANDAVTSAKIPANTIGANHIANGAVTSAKIPANTIGANHIANGAVTSAKIPANTIRASHIADGAITADKIDNPITIYQVTSPACNNQGSLTTSSSCPNIEGCFDNCGSGTIGGSKVPHRLCNGTCACVFPITIIQPNDCSNTPLGHLIP